MTNFEGKPFDALRAPLAERYATHPALPVLRKIMLEGGKSVDEIGLHCFLGALEMSGFVIVKK